MLVKKGVRRADGDERDRVILCHEPGETDPLERVRLTYRRTDHVPEGLDVGVSKKLKRHGHRGG